MDWERRRKHLNLMAKGTHGLFIADKIISQEKDIFKKLELKIQKKDKIVKAAIKWRKEFSSSAELELMKAVDECIKE